MNDQTLNDHADLHESLRAQSLFARRHASVIRRSTVLRYLEIGYCRPDGREVPTGLEESPGSIGRAAR